MRTQMLQLMLAGGCLPTVKPLDIQNDTGRLPNGGTSPVQTEALVATIADDYSLGAVATISLAHLSIDDTLSPTSGDAVIRATDSHAVLLNRLNTDTVQVFSETLREPDTEIALPDLSNPQDAVFCDDKLWVSLHNSDTMPIFDIENSLMVGSVNLEEWAGTDGHAEASTMVRQESSVFLAVQEIRQDDAWVSDGGTILQIDCQSTAVIGQFEIGPSPVLKTGTEENLLGYKTGIYGDLDGEVGLFDVDGGETHPLVRESSLGIDIHDFAFSQNHLVYSVASEDWDFQLHCQNLTTGEIQSSPVTSSYLSDLSMDDQGRLWVSKRTGWSSGAPEPSGLDVIDPSTCQSFLTGGTPLQLTLPPFNVAFR